MTLPGILQTIARVAGEDAALAVAAARGGTIASIPLPQNLTADHWLTVTVGMERARLISREVNAGSTGGQFEIPLGPNGSLKSWIRARQRVLREAIASGASIDECARIAGVDRSTVKRARRNIRGDHRDDRQGRLF